jgi:hypothetical protein
MTALTHTPTQACAELGEAEAIAALLAHLPRAGVHELLQLGRSCPDPWVADAADRFTTALTDLRSHLTFVIAEAHQGAVAAEDWIASLEQEA